MAVESSSAETHVLVTGGGTGIGAAIAVAFAAQGARVTITGRRAAIVEKQAALLRERGGLANAIAFDVTDEGAVSAGIASAVARFGRIDVLVNNAGKAESASFSRTSPDLLRQLLEVNLVQLFVCTQQVLPAMVNAGFGRIINIASTAALTGYPYVTAYCSAKHAVLGFTRALALEVVRSGVTVNAVCPGYAETPLLDGAVAKMVALTGRSEDDIRDELARSNPAGKLLKPSEIASVVTWLARAGSSAITGQAIPVAYGEVLSR